MNEVEPSWALNDRHLIFQNKTLGNQIKFEFKIKKQPLAAT